MTRRTIYRLQDIREAIAHIRDLLEGLTLDQMYDDPVTKAAFERFLEITSEASRHLPDELKAVHGPNVPWRQVADLGNVLRHVYHKSDARTLWEIYANDLDVLDRSVEAMIKAIGNDDI